MASALDQSRRDRLMATRIAAALDAADAHYVLITSPGHREGRTYLCHTLQREFRALGWRRFVFLSWQELEEHHPRDHGRSTTVIVDGPPIAEGPGVLGIPPAWLEALDGALVVARKRVTNRSDLAQTVAWLEATHIPPVGVVFNEQGFPQLRQWLESLRRTRAPAPARARIDTAAPAVATPIGAPDRRAEE